MDQPLTKISILLLFFYGVWFVWEQHKMLNEKNQEIKELNQQNQILQQQLFYDALIINSYKQQEKQNFY